MRTLSKLEGNGPLSAADRQAFQLLPVRLQTFSEKVDIVRLGDRPREASIILSGMTCRYRVLGSGQRQIFSFHLPGDMPDLHGLHLDAMDHSMAALTSTRVAFVTHEALSEFIRLHPAAGRALWRETLIDAGIFRAWLTGLGRRTAHERICHLICELFSRMRAAGLVDGVGFRMPITQAELADALGLTAVHVNRVLQDLRRDGLISTAGRVLTILDWQRLKAVCEFDPTYLHLARSPPATLAGK